MQILIMLLQDRIRRLVKHKTTGMCKVPTLKRKIGYADEEISATRAKISNMHIETEEQTIDNDMYEDAEA